MPSQMKIDGDAAFKKAIVVGASSDIGIALCDNWILKSWKLAGTYRTKSDMVISLGKKIETLVQCDLESARSVDDACTELVKMMANWDVLVLGPGLQEPVGLFSECDFDEWEKSITVNFTNQLRFLNRLLANRNSKSLNGPTVLFFAGGGVNNAPTHYSAYTVSKIAMIKMVELLAAEIPDVKFVIVGPGWVKTKIHQSILDAGERGGPSYESTVQKFKDGTFTSMEKVVECCNTLISGPREILTGRNFSVEFDCWQDIHFVDLLEKNPDMYKLRRFGNHL
jgi:NAD(P)-dependent dehydrogenase (short-subunit alcohol dehydrogenase family)